MAYENVILVLVAVGLIVFGSKKLPELFRAVGRAQVEYERAKIESKHELSQIEEYQRSSEQNIDNRSGLTREKLEEMAMKLGMDKHQDITDDELKEKILQRIRQGS